MGNKGTIFDIKKYAIHDGPGIRTTVFLKGCTMGCQWCHNPESKNFGIENILVKDRVNKITKHESFGYEITVEEVLQIVTKDKIFYDESGGGVTFSGGEPLVQIKFLLNLLQECKKSHLHTTVDTSGEANKFIGKDIYIHKSAKVNGAIFNSSSGPIVIDEGAEVMEGSILRGPIYIGKNAGVKMGAKIYGPTSIGTFSKVGGEVNNSVINGFSNKGHDGFLGNSVLGFWCNLGADTNTSNLKNDYSIVKLWNYQKESFVRSGLQFLGLVMGDHSKCGINTMFNTGTVVGVSCNVYGSGFQPNMIPSFSWGKPGSFATYQFEKAMRVAQLVMERRDKNLHGTEEMLMKEVFEKTESLRNKFH